MSSKGIEKYRVRLPERERMAAMLAAQLRSSHTIESVIAEAHHMARYWENDNDIAKKAWDLLDAVEAEGRKRNATDPVPDPADRAQHHRDLDADIRERFGGSDSDHQWRIGALKRNGYLSEAEADELSTLSFPLRERLAHAYGMCCDHIDSKRTLSEALDALDKPGVDTDREQPAQPATEEARPTAESALAEQGVFKGHEGLRGLAESQSFWDEQSYGTRLYYGPGITDYLHRDVLRAAIRALDQTPPPTLASPSAPARSVDEINAEGNAIVDGLKAVGVPAPDRVDAAGVDDENGDPTFGAYWRRSKGTHEVWAFVDAHEIVLVDSRLDQSRNTDRKVVPDAATAIATLREWLAPAAEGYASSGEALPASQADIDAIFEVENELRRRVPDGWSVSQNGMIDGHFGIRLDMMVDVSTRDGRYRVGVDFLTNRKSALDWAERALRLANNGMVDPEHASPPPLPPAEQASILDGTPPAPERTPDECNELAALIEKRVVEETGIAPTRRIPCVRRGNDPHVAESNAERGWIGERHWQTKVNVYIDETRIWVIDARVDRAARYVTDAEDAIRFLKDHIASTQPAAESPSAESEVGQ